MPTRVFINILQARSLPVMDRATGLCDAYVKPLLKGVTFDPQQTQTARKTLNPVWNEQFKCDVTDDCLLQDEPLQFRLFDYDVLSADDIIGTVYVHCNSLYEAGEQGKEKVTVYIQHIMDFNPVEDSAVGVKVLSSSVPPSNYIVTELFGLVDELLVEDDPEYNWQDSFRSSRSSNDARQLLFLVMDGKLRRQIGRKVTDSGGNALLGYQTHFDLEDNFIVARGIGTCVSLAPVLTPSSAPGPVPEPSSAVARSYVDLSSNLSNLQPLPPPHPHAHSTAVPARRVSLGDAPRETASIAQLLGALEMPALERSDSNTLTTVAVPATMSPTHSGKRTMEEDFPSLKELEPLPQAHLRMLHRSKRDHFRAALRLQEVQIFSMQEFPSGVLRYVGGMVAARSVKAIGQEGKQERVIQARDAWWNELREEIKNHARSLDCCHVVGYTETTAITEEGVCLLSAAGTAAILDMSQLAVLDRRTGGGPVRVAGGSPPVGGPEDDKARARAGGRPYRHTDRCSMCHIPYSHRSPPFSMRLCLCNICGKRYVPDVLLSTVEIPHGVAVQGSGKLLEVHVCRAKPVERKLQGYELSAARLSELLPFLEFDVHKQIMSKLKIRAHNAVFGLRMQVCIGEGLVTCMATGTSVLLLALPVPQALVISRVDAREGRVVQEARDEALDRELEQLMATSKANHLEALRAREDPQRTRSISLEKAQEDSDDSSSESSTSSDDSDSPPRPGYVLEIDDEQGVTDVLALLDEPLGFSLGVCSTSHPPVDPDDPLPPLQNLQLFTFFRRVSLLGIAPQKLPETLAALFQGMLMTIAFRLRAQGACLLCGVKSHMSLPDDNQLQLGVTAMALNLQEGPPAPTVGHEPASPGFTFEREASDVPPSLEKLGAASKAQSLDRPDGDSVVATAAGSDGSGARGEADGRSCRVELTPLSRIPGCVVSEHIDRVSVCMIREVLKVSEEGNISVWTSRLLLEGQAMCRAQAAAIGGNAVLHYNVDQIIVNNMAHKMRVYSVLMVTGDAVRIQADPNARDVP